ncbi:50S ribosomal protein L10 [Candidatus Woesearchaeota archaeon]|nr:50S ribosomal protein L10 [Candidatus Woesearchaeota archaeon]
MTEPKIQEYKKDKVKEFIDLFNSYPIIGILDLRNLPARQFQDIRAKLREHNVLIKMTKRRLMKIAIEKTNKDNLEKLEDYMDGLTAVLFSKEDPFSLYSIIKKNKTKAPIKAGQEAVNNIVVPKGPTSFAPGPIIGELGSIGIQTGVDAGKLVIKEDCLVVKEGETVNDKVAGILKRLDLKPMEIGLNLKAVWDDGKILEKDILDIDEQEYYNNIIKSAMDSFKLALSINYPADITINILLQKAHAEALNLALNENILTDKTTGIILSKANAQAVNLNSLLDLKIEVPEETTSETKKPEENKEEKAEDKKEEVNEQPKEIIKEEKKEPEEFKTDKTEEIKEEKPEKKEDKKNKL